MKKFFCGIISAFLLLCSLVLTACNNETNKINPYVYFGDTATIKQYTKTFEEKQSMQSFVDADEIVLSRYKYITFDCQNEWTYGLTVEKIEFDVVSNCSATLDFLLTITHLKNAELFDQTYDFYYTQKTFYATCIKDKLQHISLPINDEFLNTDDAQISILIEDSSLNQNADLKYSITNFSVFGEHIANNY